MFMIKYKKELNPAQWEAVSAIHGPVLVIAGAGSGKTRTIVYRLAHLVDQGVAPESILLLTFTRKASREMLDRAEELLGQGMSRTMGGTFHSLAYGMLRRFSGAPGISEGFTVMDRSDAESVVRRVRDEFGVGKGDRSFPKKRTVLELISKSRNKELSLPDLLQKEACHLLTFADDIREISVKYAEFKAAHGLMDYDDLLFDFERLLTSHEPARDFARFQYRFVMVDEYQDTNLVQARLVKLLSGEEQNVMVVGDDAQSIYAFRGANVYNILNFPDIFPQAKLIRLEQNYRSTQPILNLANQILEQAEDRFPKNLFTARANGAQPKLLRTHSDKSQANVVLARVRELSRTYPLNEIAVLFRAGYHSYPIEIILNKLGMKFQKFGGVKFSEAAHVKDALAYLRLLQNPADLPSWQRVLAFVKGVGQKTCAKIHAAVTAGDEGAVSGMGRRFPGLKTLLIFLDSLRGPDLSLSLLLERVLEYYQPLLEEKYPDDYPRRRAGLEELASIAAGYRDLDTFLADICLESPEETHGKDKSRENALVLSTVHSAKGLEWSAVLIIDLVEGRFPSHHAMAGPEEMEEERRLLYVACTRARDCLELFVPLTLSGGYQGKGPAGPSPFVSELPRDCFEEWRENYTGGLTREIGFNSNRADLEHTTGATPAPSLAPEPRPPKIAPKKLGHCKHKIFGRGKIIAAPSTDKFRVHFPGFGVKVILADYLEIE